MGYRQNSKALQIQAEELKQNTEALRLQVQEMKESVLQQSLLVEAATEDLNLAKLQHGNNTIKDMVKSQPFIHLHAFAFKWIRDDSLASIQAQNDREFDNIKIEISYVNSRTLARELILRIKNKNKELYGLEAPIFKTTEKPNKIELKLDYPESFQWGSLYILDVQFSYLDEIDQPQFQKFKIELYQNELNRSQSTKVIRGETSFQNMD
ncbi:hypothetical protein [Acinetobacter bereziniae]|uniref:hypothetical protein n=1 Tax=Acinetobacter bereziniae TaxID=106648 RepID=UPI0021CDAB95|nr:hypothetical protein [Acinetobacter bereziniae]